MHLSWRSYRSRERRWYHSSHHIHFNIGLSSRSNIQFRTASRRVQRGGVWVCKGCSHPFWPLQPYLEGPAAKILDSPLHTARLLATHPDPAHGSHDLHPAVGPWHVQASYVLWGRSKHSLRGGVASVANPRKFQRVKGQLICPFDR